MCDSVACSAHNIAPESGFVCHTQYGLYGTGSKEAKSKFFDSALCMFVCTSVFDYIVVRNQNVYGVPYKPSSRHVAASYGAPASSSPRPLRMDVAKSDKVTHLHKMISWCILAGSHVWHTGWPIRFGNDICWHQVLISSLGHRINLLLNVT